MACEGIIFRPATPEDAEPISDIARQIWHMGCSKAMEDRHGLIGDKSWQDHVGENMQASMRKFIAAGHCIVAESNGRIAGWSTWSLDEAQSIGSVGYNGVHPDFRGRGLGTELVRQAIEQIRKAGMKIATVTTGLNEGHAAARAVYEKLGFEPLVESVYYTMELE